MGIIDLRVKYDLFRQMKFRSKKVLQKTHPCHGLSIPCYEGAMDNVGVFPSMGLWNFQFSTP